jgi:hypothetical protein
MQYVRDGLEELFRIVAVVSLPQTAFAATGAGVKSSVLFLKKFSAAQTKNMRDTKQALKDRIRKQEHFMSTPSHGGCSERVVNEVWDYGCTPTFHIRNATSH